jgi:hypothetical protein
VNSPIGHFFGSRNQRKAATHCVSVKFRSKQEMVSLLRGSQLQGNLLRLFAFCDVGWEQIE